MPLLRDNEIQQLDSNKTLVKISTVHQLMPLSREKEV
jgi:hypothetical protein